MRIRFGLVTQATAANLAEVVKPATDGEGTSEGTHQAVRGGWEGRASRESLRVLGDPARRSGERATWRGNP